MSGIWKIEKNLIIDGKNYYPDAKEIFAAVGNDASILQNEIRFSKIGLPLFCNINTDGEKILLKIFTKKGNNEYPVYIKNGKIIDYIIINNTWHFINANLIEINDLLKRADIEVTGEITLKQYLLLIKSDLFSEDKIISNYVDNNQIQNLNSDLYIPPEKLNAKLYKYQETGFIWLKNTIKQTGGCILGDEMGLGKTLQAIALCQDFINSNRNNILIIAPVSLLANWNNELLKFSPSLTTIIHQGSNRTGFYKDLINYDVVIISYSTAVLDIGLLKRIKWDLVILDEAQNLKNPMSERAKVLSTLNRENTLLITGTPFENHITDIWSLYNFILPGFLGDLNTFKKNVSDDIIGASFIEPIISPLLLRRRVTDVELCLPEKIIIPQPIYMSEYECDLYEEERNYLLNSANKSFSLPLIQKLRMLCTHPKLLIEDEIEPTCSYKYQRLCELLQEIIIREEKAIIFTSYKKMFKIFENDLAKRFSVPIWSINGDTEVQERQKIVEQFNKLPNSGVLCLNPKAAGVGLNITGANHVIHYNLEWNPALEDQSTARAYRNGQKKTVFVYRLFYKNTIEEAVNEKLFSKRNIANVAIVGNNGETLNSKDIVDALNMSPKIR